MRGNKIMDIEFTTKEEIEQFAKDVFDGKKPENLSGAMPTIESLGRKDIEFATPEEVRDFIVGLFKSKKS